MTETTGESVLSPIQPDLEKLRDERVVPVARGVLADFVESIPSTKSGAQTDFTALIVKVLQRGLDADLNLTTENPYVFQLVLSAIASFNTVLQKSKMSPIDDERYTRIAHELLALLVTAEVPMGMAAKPDVQEAALASIQPAIEEIFARENLNSLELSYILEGVMRALKTTEQLFSGNVQRGVERMEAKILGIEAMTDLSMRTLDKTLQTDAAEFVAKREAIA